MSIKILILIFLLSGFSLIVFFGWRLYLIRFIKQQELTRKINSTDDSFFSFEDIFKFLSVIKKKNGEILVFLKKSFSQKFSFLESLKEWIGQNFFGRKLIENQNGLYGYWFKLNQSKNNKGDKSKEKKS